MVLYLYDYAQNSSLHCTDTLYDVKCQTYDDAEHVWTNIIRTNHINFHWDLVKVKDKDLVKDLDSLNFIFRSTNRALGCKSIKWEFFASIFG